MRESESSVDHNRQFLRLFSDSKDNYGNKQNPLQGLGGVASPVADLARLVGKDRDFSGYSGSQSGAVQSGGGSQEHRGQAAAAGGKESDGWRRLVPVSGGIAQHVIDSAKKEYYRQYRFPGGQDEDPDDASGQIKVYLKSVAEEDRPAVAYTLNQIYFRVIEAVDQALRQKDPSWKPGRPVDPRNLDEIFSGECPPEKFTEGIEIIRRLDFKA